MRSLAIVAAAACGAPATPLRTPPARPAQRYVYETTVAAHRTRFELTVLAGAVTLVEHSDGAIAHVYRGMLHGAPVGFDVELAAPGAPSLPLHCAAREVPIALADAVLACAAWTPKDRPPLAVIACGGPGEPDDEPLDDDDDRLVFAPEPGVERVVSRAACGRSTGLRRVRPAP